MRSVSIEKKNQNKNTRKKTIATREKKCVIHIAQKAAIEIHIRIGRGGVTRSREGWVTIHEKNIQFELQF